MAEDIRGLTLSYFLVFSVLHLLSHEGKQIFAAV